MPPFLESLRVSHPTDDLLPKDNFPFAARLYRFSRKEAGPT